MRRCGSLGLGGGRWTAGTWTAGWCGEAGREADRRLGSAAGCREGGVVGAGMMSRVMGALGAAVGRRPGTWAWVALLVALASCAGLLRLNLVSESEKLWVPQHSEPQKHKEAVDAVFRAAGSRFVQIVAQAKEPGGNVLTPPALEELFDAWEAIAAIEVEGKTYSTGLCSQYSGEGTCAPFGTLRLWNWDRGAFEAAGRAEGDLRAAWDRATYPDGALLDPLSIFGLPQRNDSGVIVAAETLRIIISLESDEGTLSKSGWNEWHDKFIEVMEQQRSSNTVLDPAYWTSLSIDKELQRLVTKDIALVMAAIILMVVFSILVLTRFHPGGGVDMVRSRTQVGNVGVLSVVLSMGMGYGLASAFGITFTSLQMILPFILLGIGIDDCFVLTQGLDQVNTANPNLPVEERMRKLMESAGVSITVTSCTNFAAFMLGSISSIPAIQYFCLYAGISIICDYLLQITFFLAFLAMNERQVDEGRNCLVPCRTPQELSGTSQPVRSFSSFENIAVVLKRTLGRSMASVPAKAVIATFFVVFLSVSSWGITELEEGLPLQDLVPDDSYVRNFFAADDRTFNAQVGLVSGLYTMSSIHGEDQGVRTPAGQKETLQALENAKQLDCVLADQTGNLNWLSVLHSIAHDQGRLSEDGTIPEEDFESVLDMAETLPQFEAFKNDYVRDIGSSPRNVRASVIRVVHSPEGGDYAARAKCLRSVYSFNEIYENSQGKNKVFLYAYPYIYWEQDRVLLQEVRRAPLPPPPPSPPPPPLPNPFPRA